MMFRELLGQVDEGEFRAKHWGRSPSVFNNPKLPSLLQLGQDYPWDLVLAAHYKWGELLLAKSDESNERFLEDDCTLTNVCEAYRQGFTVIINDIHERVPSLCRLAGDAQIQLNAFCNINSYVTPAGGQGLAPHADPQDVFIIQMSGSKQWFVHKPVFDLPMTPAQCAYAEGGSSQHVSALLEPGKVLYIPRGWPHYAVAASDSTHLTLTLTPYRVATIFKATFGSIVDTMAQSTKELREGVAAEHQVSQMVGMLRDLLSSCSDEQLLTLMNRAVDKCRQEMSKADPRHDLPAKFRA